ncbi:MAG: NAD-dependent epimerase/dehydratase family protein [Pyrinomonadaceae bacterium]
MTGTSGFIGSHLLRRLAGEDLQVAILLRPESDCWRIESLMDLQKITRITGDFRRPESIRDAVKSFAPSLVIHLAWSGVGNQFRNDLVQVDDNLSASLSLLRLARDAGCRAWVGLGSQAEYGPLNAQLDEQAETKPTTLYGVTKLCTQMLSSHLCEQFGMRFCWLRLFSAYGPMDDPRWMIPELILSLLDGKRPALTKGSQRWDYIYAGDVVDAIYSTAINTEASGVFNLGSGEAHTLRSIVEQIRDLVNPKLDLGFGAVPFRADQVMHLQANVERLREVVGWRPQTSLAEGLAKTVEWYREHRSQFKR